MKFARHLEPISPEEIRRAKDNLSIKPPTLGERIEHRIKNGKRIN